MTNVIALKTQVLETTITVSGNDLVAAQNIIELVAFAHKQKQQMEATKKVYDDACKLIKDFMQSSETLISPDGARLATWKQADSRLQLDTDALKREFNDVYVACCNIVPGTRPFCLK